MPSFISNAACRGRRPSQFASFDGRHRPALIARMLKERHVARFIVAPSGYGKTSIALEYAETIFSWVHTCWINGQSPCFIRDLDDRKIAAECLGNDPDLALVVIDDVPQLDAERSDQLSGEIDALLARNCEVVLTCLPANDMIGQMQRDRMRLSAADLLLDDAELDESRPADERQRTPSSMVPPARRVPSLVWGAGGQAPSRFAQGVLSEELPGDVLVAMCTVLVVQEGSFDDVAAMGVVDRQVLSEVASDYPHLGFDAGFDRFSAAKLSIAELASAVKRQLDFLVESSVFDSCEQLVGAWARLLLANGFAGRACDLVREVCPIGHRATWLLEQVEALVAQACFMPLLRLVRDQVEAKESEKPRLAAVQALCYRMLGAKRESSRAARRCAFDPSAPKSARICALLILADDDDARRADGAIAGLEKVLSDSADHLGEERSGGAAELSSPWLQLAQARVFASQGVLALVRFWALLKQRGSRRGVLCLCAARVFALAGDLPEVDRVALAREGSLRDVEEYVRELLSTTEPLGLDFFVASAGLAWEQARQSDGETLSRPLGTHAMIALRQYELNLVMQRREFEAEQKELALRGGDWRTTHPNAYASGSDLAYPSKRADNIPILTLKLFGRMEVAIGDEPIDPKNMRMQNVRSLLVLLAVNQGKEVSRDAMAKVMWPQSSEKAARKNFYSVWARLRRALTLPDGTCPYLIRHQYGCSLAQRYVRSDAARLSEICRELLFGAPNLEQWSVLFAEIDRDFSSDLMPGEDKNVLVIQARNEYRARLIDALVAATVSVIDIGNPKWGIWFARSAISHDETREDAYVALMRAQIASNQRTAAMMTYLKCRRALSDQLGIDPSPETTALYESLLDT